MGKCIVTQNDVETEGRFDDIVAYAGWSMDDHFPAGFYHKDSYPTVYHPAPQPWGLPLRCMISENIGNLVFAGRNISVTHAAMSSSRVMGTCAILGQALGTAVAVAVKSGVAVENADVTAIQKALMDDDCFIPWHERQLSALTLAAKCNADIVRNGKDRGEDNLWRGKDGDSVEYSFDRDTEIKEIRLVFDSDLNRRYYNMPCAYPLEETKFKLPSTLIKDYVIEGTNESGEKFTLGFKNNRRRFVRHAVDMKVKSLRFIPLSTHGCDEFRLFAFEIK